jgi:hypothetical protein
MKQQLQTENLYLKQEYTLLSKIKDSSMMEWKNNFLIKSNKILNFLLKRQLVTKF